jgi:hypothetical protein
MVYERSRTGERFILNYYHHDGSIELVKLHYDYSEITKYVVLIHTLTCRVIKMSATFLKRMKVDGVELSALFFGEQIVGTK